MTKKEQLCMECFKEGTPKDPLIEVDYVDIRSGVTVHSKVHDACAGQSSTYTLVIRK